VVRAWEYIYNDHIDEGVDAIVKQLPNERLDLGILRGQIVEYRPFSSPMRQRQALRLAVDADWKVTIDILEKTRRSDVLCAVGLITR